MYDQKYCTSLSRVVTRHFKNKEELVDIQILMPHRGLYYLAHAVLAGTCILANFIIMPVPLQMLTYTLSILYIGSHQSLKQMEVSLINNVSSRFIAIRKHCYISSILMRLRILQLDETGEKKNGETMTQHDAMMFPVFGSAALFSLQASKFQMHFSFYYQ